MKKLKRRLKKMNTPKAGWIGVVLGAFVMLLGYLIYAYSSSDFLIQAWSEIFGAGVAIFVLSLVFALFKLRVSG